VRLATLRDGTRDGALIVVGRDGDRYVRAAGATPTLQAALDDWDRAAPALAALATRLDAGGAGDEIEALDVGRLGPPLPRAYEWIDGSAFLEHVRRVRKARGAVPPATLETDPLVYQGGSGVLLGPRDDIPLVDPAWGLDFESEVAVILGDTPQGTRAADAPAHVRLLTLANDITLRNLVPDELAKGFGFFQSKPARGACTCGCDRSTTARSPATPTRARCTSPSSI
jgi:fumarylacetoacetate (FAA) hydrolase